MPNIDASLSDIPSEHQEQCAFVQWFRYQFTAFSYRLFAIPNGGLRDVKIAYKLKQEGVVPGVADLFLMVPASGYHGLFIEMKRIKDGKQSDCQKKFEQECKKSGYLYAICRGASEAISLVVKYLQGEMDNTIK